MSGTKIVLETEGFDDFEETLLEFMNDFGPKDARRILNRAVKKAMMPVLYTAKMFAPDDTGALRASLQVEARTPTAKDKRSKYVDQNDAVIAAVTTAPGHKLKKLKWTKTHRNKQGDVTHYTSETGIDSDARAPAMEFGTAHTPAHPFLRSALETESNGVLLALGDFLKDEIAAYEKRRSNRLKRDKKNGILRG